MWYDSRPLGGFPLNAPLPGKVLPLRVESTNAAFAAEWRPWAPTESEANALAELARDALIRLLIERCVDFAVYGLLRGGIASGIDKHELVSIGTLEAYKTLDVLKKNGKQIAYSIAFLHSVRLRARKAMIRFLQGPRHEAEIDRAVVQDRKREAAGRRGKGAGIAGEDAELDASWDNPAEDEDQEETDGEFHLSDLFRQTAEDAETEVRELPHFESFPPSQLLTIYKLAAKIESKQNKKVYGQIQGIDRFQFDDWLNGKLPSGSSVKARIDKFLADGIRDAVAAYSA